MEDSTGAEDNSTNQATLVLNDLVTRARILLTELEAFRHHLRIVRLEGSVELASFKGSVNSELSMLERLLAKPAQSTTIHAARSSNLPFLEKVWTIAKRSKNVASLHKRIYYNSPSRSLAQAMHHVDLGSNDKAKKNGVKSAAVTVDAIVDSGHTWIKASLVTNTRLLFDLAKQGWQSNGSDFDDEENGSFPVLDDDDADVPLVKNAKELCLASQQFRVKTKTPIVHLFLPRVRPGETDEIDGVLEQCRLAGAVVHCGEAACEDPAMELAFNMMAPDPLSLFTDTLNIDCTILLALVSEFSHARVSKESWFHKALQRQVEIEGNENLLPSLLYPALGSRSLVCTEEAAKRMREIVDTIGTPSEKARTCIFLGDDGSKSHQDLVKEMQQFSAYDVPKNLQLPIRVVDQNENGCQSALPPEAAIAAANMTAINKSVFLFGWASGYTTITSNRSVVKQVESDLEKNEDLEDSVWPSIWLCPTARSLVGKEKRGEKKQDRENGIIPLPDPLHREGHRRHGLDVLSSREGREVEDRRPNGYECDEVLEAKKEARRRVENEHKMQS